MLLQIKEPSAESNEIQKDELIVGIDLGTTNSLIAYILDGKVSFFTDAAGHKLHPSIVAYDTSDKVSAHLDAKENIVISSIKSLMGKNYDDVKDVANNYAFTIVSDENDSRQALKIKLHNKNVSPEEVSAQILRHLKEIAENNLRQEVKKVVITVPAYFDEAAKNATKFAANLAQLEVIRLVNEPTAAALAYGLDSGAEGVYCVYDLGGGTFDISVLKMQKGVFKVLGVSGDNRLGGDDFDNAIIAEITKRTGQKFDNKNLYQAKLIARKIKEDLSYQTSSKAQLSISQAANDFSLTKQEFENLIAQDIQKTITLTQNLLDDLDLESHDIKGVVMVGGSTRIPLIVEKLAAIFGKDKILNKIDPDHIVAAGAAWQAYNLSKYIDSSNKNLLLDVVPLSLGIEMMGGIVEKIITRNSALPIKVSKEFTTYVDNQNGMKFHVTQGEAQEAINCRSLAFFEIKNIPAMKAGEARVELTFSVDADGLLTVSAMEKTTKQKQEIEVKPSYGLTESEIKEMLVKHLTS